MTHQTQFLTTVDCDEAHRLFRDSLTLSPLGTECVAVSEALHRILSSPVVAKTNVPCFDRSNFDGFAVQSDDVIGATETDPICLDLLDAKIPAGVQPEFALSSGQAVSISTGGMIPRGANAVCLVEHTEVSGRQLRIVKSVHAGSGISFTGSDISCGETVLRAGTLLTSRETGVLAAIGETEVEVFSKPKVAVISTGNEIIAPGQNIRPAQVYDSNARIISDAVRELGGEPIEMGIAVDDQKELEAIVSRALHEADVVLLSGGTSKGQGDLCYEVVSQYKDPGIVAHGVALKPGKPICLGVTRGKPLVVLPGFPTSAIFTFHEFIAPVVQCLAGQNLQESSSVVRARLATKVLSEMGRTEFLLVGLLQSPEGDEWMAYPMGKGSGSVTTFSRADGFVTIEKNVEMVDRGTVVEVQKMGSETRPADLVVMGSHCLVLDQILNDLQMEGITVKFFPVGSTAGLRAVKNGDCDLAGIHLYDAESGTFNLPFCDEQVILETGYPRELGLVYRNGIKALQEKEARPAAEQLAYLASHADLLMINRNQGSGTRIMTDQMLDRLGLPRRPVGYETQVSNHHAVCAAIEQGRADWGVATQDVVQLHAELAFVPIQKEQFDFVISKRRFNPEVIEVFRACLDRHKKSNSDNVKPGGN